MELNSGQLADLETLEKVLPRMRLYVVDEGTRLRLVKPEPAAPEVVPGG